MILFFFIFFAENVIEKIEDILHTLKKATVIYLNVYFLSVTATLRDQ